MTDIAKDNCQMYQRLVMARLKKFFGEKSVCSDGYRAWKNVPQEVK